MKTYRFRRLAWPVCRAVLALLLAAVGSASWAVDIANGPLFSSSSSNVKPNLMFILDDSGSMKSDYLPDDSNFSTSTPCLGNSPL